MCKLSFDSWFASSKEYEKLKKKDYLKCHQCGSLKVEKNLMSPNVIKSKTSNSKIKQIYKYNKIKKKIAEYQKFIEKNFEYVGENFAYEARSIHYGNKKKSKNIYGSVSNDELKELKEEEIDIEVIPWIENKNN
tara:strand:- start:1498 stop:1899 length:402 start_codon:yes stop_codon:yes gene_type:complete